MTARREQPARRARLSRDDWLGAARSALIAGGIEAVRIGRLARDLGVTRGSFYWHFRDREDLYGTLLASWEATSTALFERLLDRQHRKAMDEFMALCDLWIEEKSFSPALDSAMRDWARASRRAAQVVRRVDTCRIELIQRIFLDFGCDESEAFVRARVTYFHQVGYYALGLEETRGERRALLPLYIRVLTGIDPSSGRESD